MNRPRNSQDYKIQGDINSLPLDELIINQVLMENEIHELDKDIDDIGTDMDLYDNNPNMLSRLQIDLKEKLEKIKVLKKNLELLHGIITQKQSQEENKWKNPYSMYAKPQLERILWQLIEEYNLSSMSKNTQACAKLQVEIDYINELLGEKDKPESKWTKKLTKKVHSKIEQLGLFQENIK